MADVAGIYRHGAVFAFSFGRIARKLSIRLIRHRSDADRSGLRADDPTDAVYAVSADRAGCCYALGTGMGLSIPATGALIMHAADPARSGVASATLNMMRQTGMTLGWRCSGTLDDTAGRSVLRSTVSCRLQSSLLPAHRAENRQLPCRIQFHSPFAGGF